MGDKRNRWNEFLSEHNDSLRNSDAFYHYVAYTLHSGRDMDGILSATLTKGTICAGAGI